MGNGEVIITELAAAVPEPASVALLGAGLLSLAALRRRRRANIGGVGKAGERRRPTLPLKGCPIVRAGLSPSLVQRTRNLFRTSLRPILAAIVAEIADQFLLLGVDRDHWLLGGIAAVAMATGMAPSTIGREG